MLYTSLHLAAFVPWFWTGTSARSPGSDATHGTAHGESACTIPLFGEFMTRAIPELGTD